MANDFWDAANNAFNMGQATAKAIHDRQDAANTDAINQAAGNAFAGGDYQGGAKAFYQGGHLASGMTAQNYGQSQQDRALKLQTDADALKKTQLADQTTAALAGLRALQGITDPNQRAQYYASSIAPVLKQRGVPDEGIAHIGQIAGDDNALKAEEMALGQAATKYGFNNVGGDLYRTDPDTGDVTPVAQGYRKPEYVTPAAGTTAILVDPGRAGGVIGPGGTAQPVQGQPAGLPPPNAARPQNAFTPPVQGPVSSNFGTRAKPGPGASTNHQGQDFAVPVGTPVNAAKDGTVKFAGTMGGYGNVVIIDHGDGTETRYGHLSQIGVKPGDQVQGGQPIAASGQSGNATGPNLHFEVRQNGVPVDPRAAFAQQQSTQVAANGTGAWSPPRSVQGPSAKEGHASTPAELKAAGLPDGTAAWTDKSGKPTPYAAEFQQNSASGVDPKLAGLTGQDLISKLSAAQAQTVKALSEGRLQFPSGMALSKPYWQQMLGLVGQYDPTFDQANPRSRATTRVDFTSGKSAQNITALNTVIGHLDDLDHSIDGLHNMGLPVANRVVNWAAGASGQDAAIKTFETAKTAVANELTRVFRGTGGAEADIQGWQKQLDAASSPESLRSVVHIMASLINSRLEALGEQYSQGMGRSSDPIRLLTPDKQAMFDRMRNGIAPQEAAHGGAPSTGIPPNAPTATGPGGHKIYFDGQTWKPFP